MMKSTAEDLKLVAEGIGIKDVRIGGSNNRYVFYGDYYPVQIFNPTEDAEQCIKVLEWLRTKAHDIEIDLDGSYIGIILNFTDYKVGYSGYDKDFKTAVFLAAVEYIKNKK